MEGLEWATLGPKYGFYLLAYHNEAAIIAENGLKINIGTTSDVQWMKCDDKR